MSIRCYIPTTLDALRRGLASVHAVAPDAHGRGLGGDELEAREFDALYIAAALAATQSFEDGPADIQEPSPRAVVAYDAPDATAGEELVDGFDLLSLPEVDVTSIVSIHIDEVEVWEEAAKIGADGGHEAAEDHLGDSDLLWYDATELPELLRERS
ncbi:MAG: DUF6912 family protein [Brevibacterium aurantiacum]|uniref:Uncharacterized protein n=1 Tax=Brevibacterium aurantiacum TaxID=273384 RepID=A0A2A3YYR2_BREAU|nr:MULTISPECIES: hypothetical protein [Brevibacterium]MDN5592627.1 hypothetical protein [Brevibacterium sp.]AZL05473.1 hypothetical protein CXR24_07615 [Brevibacterium aurantiacum]AZL09059.1 hypothetical protein CXR26_07315 [Brevibacterium aurantiacum]AZT93146.1 hypothetical protein CXR23_08290 [Brevibacterium aurantiacum]AZT96928.1 hypothetical protein CXR27_07845 [Brevibacterium aurantiacum]